jgi:anaerobic ribonucleoside-triphosphate reductase activating protein
MSKMRIAGAIPCSFIDGEGVRYVVFTQGCKHHCKGCHNPETWDFNGGFEVDVADIAEEIKKRPLLDGITLSGGDPFFQHDACVELLKLLPGVNVWVYTGFEYDDIKHTALAKMADVLVTGRFIQELACDGKMYGSSNQKIIKNKEKEDGRN